MPNSIISEAKINSKPAFVTQTMPGQVIGGHHAFEGLACSAALLADDERFFFQFDRFNSGDTGKAMCGRADEDQLIFLHWESKEVRGYHLPFHDCQIQPIRQQTLFNHPGIAFGNHYRNSRVYPPERNNQLGKQVSANRYADSNS